MQPPSPVARGSHWLRRCLLFGLGLAAASPASALRIVLTNDDGFENRNIQALFTALKAAGHDVILSAPFRNQSGASAHLGALTNLSPTPYSAASGRVAAGAPGVGPTTLAPDQYYVDSSPVAAVLYGLDYPAIAKWGGPPDLVLSGPNAGNNLGVGMIHSGTIGAVVTVLNRGIPAIAISAANADAAVTGLLSALVLRVVAAVEHQGKIMLPRGIGLSVNLPVLDATRTASSYRIAFTQIGTNPEPNIRFYLTGTESPLALTATASDARNAGREERAFNEGQTITVSPIQGTFQAPPDLSAQVLAQMRPLFATTAPIANPQFANLAVRGLVGTGSASQIAGFVIAGTSPKTVLVRAGGPALASLEVADALADPRLEVFDATQRLVARNDNWSDDPEMTGPIAAAAAKAGAFPWTEGSADAALLVTLAPGAYTAVVQGVAGATGIALIEVYDPHID